jgi:hypothetical protein
MHCFAEFIPPSSLFLTKNILRNYALWRCSYSNTRLKMSTFIQLHLEAIVLMFIICQDSEKYASLLSYF